MDCKGLDQHRQKHLLNHIQTKANELSPGLMLVALCEVINQLIVLFMMEVHFFYRIVLFIILLHISMLLFVDNLIFYTQD